MAIIREKAYGKINLTLDVLGVRTDGYHDLKSVMQTVSLFDDVQMCIGTKKNWELICATEGVPCDERNLAWKAARLFFEKTGQDPEGLTISLTKRIPSGAGMGGGSADAAAVLRGLNRHYASPFSPTELADLGAEIGSDVPFCVLGGTMMAEGRGERLRRLPAMPKCTMVLCKPDFSVSTPVLFRKLDQTPVLHHPDNDAMERALQAGALEEIAGHIFNVFDPVVSAEHPQIDHIKSIFAQTNAIACQMTGSGSVVFAIMPDASSGERAVEELRKTYSQVFCAEPV